MSILCMHVDCMSAACMWATCGLHAWGVSLGTRLAYITMIRYRKNIVSISKGQEPEWANPEVKKMCIPYEHNIMPKTFGNLQF